VKTIRGLTRQEALWWVAPTLHHWRKQLLEGTGVLGRNLPVLLFANNLGWFVTESDSLISGDYRLPKKYDYSWKFWAESRTKFGRLNNGTWSSLIDTEHKEALQKNRKPPVLDNLEGNADAERFWRFVNAAYDRFTAPEPEVASLWQDNGKLMCGWDPLPPEDGRLPNKKHPNMKPITWFGNVEWIHVEEWTWRVERTDLRYDGVYANANPEEIAKLTGNWRVTK